MYAYQRICFEKKLLQTFTPHNITCDRGNERIRNLAFPLVQTIFGHILYPAILVFDGTQIFRKILSRGSLDNLQYFDQDWVLYMFMRKYHSNQSMQFTCNRGGGVNVNIHVNGDVYLVQTLDEHTFVGFVNLKKNQYHNTSREKIKFLEI